MSSAHNVGQLSPLRLSLIHIYMKPQNFEDIIAAISLYRPGPMDSIPRYIEGKNNPDAIHYLHPKLKPILDVTYGCMVYQEQVCLLYTSRCV